MKGSTVANMIPLPKPVVRKGNVVKFGKIPQQNRGIGDLFDPPRTKVDHYFWLRDDERKSEEVIQYLKSENEYCAAATQHSKNLEEEVYKELKSHLKETDCDVPFPVGNSIWKYYSMTVEGKSYPINCRTKSEKYLDVCDLPIDEHEIILDENKISEDLKAKYCDVGNIAVAPSHKFLGYSVDTVGYETYSIHFKDLETLQDLEKLSIKDTAGDLVWGPDDEVVFYSKQDKAHRPYQLWARVHPLDSDKCIDQLVWEEPDSRFWLGFWKSASGKYLFVSSKSKETAEVHMIDLTSLDLESDNLIKDSLRLIEKRKQGVLYKVDHYDALDCLLIVSNLHGKKEFSLYAVHLDDPSSDKWYEMPPFAYDSDRYLRGVQCFKEYAVVSGRSGGYTQLWVLHFDHQDSKLAISSVNRIEFEEEACEVTLSSKNKVYDAQDFRVIYSSMVTPSSTCFVNHLSCKPITVKVKEVPNYDPTLYESSRIEVKARDNTMIPMSIVYKKEFSDCGGENIADKLKQKPVFLYGYGSYGICIDPSFSMTRLPLLDRGMVYCVAHIRGGSECGRKWYEDEGKYLKKCNTFNDFIDCAKYLRSSGIASSIAIEGRSAGGLLVGASLNRAPPGLFDVALAGVPFVDVMTTMCDASIPLTVEEWEEWGNPNDEKYFSYIDSYSPIDNLSAESSTEEHNEKCSVFDFPALLITAGLHDPRVAYWEPAKWMANMRYILSNVNDAENKPLNFPLLLLKTDLSSGHFSASDRYRWLKERAFDYAFVLDQLQLSSRSKM